MVRGRRSPCGALCPKHQLGLVLCQLVDGGLHVDPGDLLDEQVRFLPGWFRDTLPTAPIERLALLRLDGDLYDSTLDALSALYPRLSPGGYTIVDDYGSFEECRGAVHDYIDRAGEKVDIQRVDDEAVYWQKR